MTAPAQHTHTHTHTHTYEHFHVCRSRWARYFQKGHCLSRSLSLSHVLQLSSTAPVRLSFPSRGAPQRLCVFRIRTSMEERRTTQQQHHPAVRCERRRGSGVRCGASR